LPVTGPLNPDRINLNAAPEDKNAPLVILAIDDDPKVVSLYQQFLSSEGYQVIPIMDPTRVTEQTKRHLPFAVILDMVMPDRDGWQILYDLKNDPITQRIPILLTTVNEEDHSGISLGVADFLMKPIAKDDLADSINRLNWKNQIRHILVVNNDPDDVGIIEKVLKDDAPFRISFAQGGIQAWNMINQPGPLENQVDPPAPDLPVPIDAILLDLFMPGLEAFSLISRMRSNPIHRNIPILAITEGNLSTEQHQQLVDFGKQLLSGAVKEKELLAYLGTSLAGFGTNKVTGAGKPASHPR
jgi:CheY-like chemotaxis protein